MTYYYLLAFCGGHTATYDFEPPETGGHTAMFGSLPPDGGGHTAMFGSLLVSKLNINCS